MHINGLDRSISPKNNYLRNLSTCPIFVCVYIYIYIYNIYIYCDVCLNKNKIKSDRSNRLIVLYVSDLY